MTTNKSRVGKVEFHYLRGAWKKLKSLILRKSLNFLLILRILYPISFEEGSIPSFSGKTWDGMAKWPQNIHYYQQIRQQLLY